MRSNEPWVMVTEGKARVATYLYIKPRHQRIRVEGYGTTKLRNYKTSRLQDYYETTQRLVSKPSNRVGAVR